MNKVVSVDGTVIAYDRLGGGSAVVLACGGPVDRTVNAELAELLASELTVFNYDRRGRGDSGDTAPYTLEREFEDLDAVAAAGGTAYVYGPSAAAVLALQAATRGSAISRLVCWEPPYIIRGTRPALPTTTRSSFGPCWPRIAGRTCWSSSSRQRRGFRWSSLPTCGSSSVGWDKRRWLTRWYTTRCWSATLRSPSI